METNIETKNLEEKLTLAITFLNSLGLTLDSLDNKQRNLLNNLDMIKIYNKYGFIAGNLAIDDKDYIQVFAKDNGLEIKANYGRDNFESLNYHMLKLGKSILKGTFTFVEDHIVLDTKFDNLIGDSWHLVVGKDKDFSYEKVNNNGEYEKLVIAPLNIRNNPYLTYSYYFKGIQEIKEQIVVDDYYTKYDGTLLIDRRGTQEVTIASSTFDKVIYKEEDEEENIINQIVDIMIKFNPRYYDILKNIEFGMSGWLPKILFLALPDYEKNDLKTLFGFSMEDIICQDEIKPLVRERKN